jgi:hypothetical protein
VSVVPLSEIMATLREKGVKAQARGGNDDRQERRAEEQLEAKRSASSISPGQSQDRWRRSTRAMTASSRPTMRA